MNTVFICDFNMQAFWVMGMSAVSIICFQDHTKSILQGSPALFLNFMLFLMFIPCSKDQSFISVTKHRSTHLIGSTTFTRLAVMHWNCNWCKLKHTQTYLYYNQGAWLPLSHAIKSGVWRKLCNEELHNLYCSPNIITKIKSRRMTWWACSMHGQMRKLCNILVKKNLKGRDQ